MTNQRWRDLMMDDTACLTNSEIEEGWHFCFGGWDGLLIGHGMPEFDICECPGFAVERTRYKESIKKL